MSPPVVVAGAGMGGLAAALRLARQGRRVRVFEARDRPGGLASGLAAGGLHFDGGPYVLLDRPGLTWAFAALGLRLDELARLRRIDDVYEFAQDGAPALRFLADLDATAAGFERLWPGSARRYADFVRATAATYARLQPLLLVSRPGALDLLRAGAWREAPFLLRSLRDVLARARLPRPLAEAVAVWTHVAGQTLEGAPSFLAFVPALIHGAGACYPQGGIRVLPELLAQAGLEAGVEIEYGARVTAIRTQAGRVEGVVTPEGFVAAQAVVSDVGLGTYLALLDALPERPRQRLAALPLQSPGVCAYLRVRGERRPPYLRFRVSSSGCRLFVAAGLFEEGEAWPARLIAPVDHSHAEADGPAGQAQRLESLLAESWWRAGLAADVVATRVPQAWGRDFLLYRNAMNPVMTAAFARAGRLPHRSPHARGLYLAGSATHPGQWVSFCAISGVLAADCLHADLG